MQTDLFTQQATREPPPVPVVAAPPADPPPERQPATTTARAYIKMLADMVKAANGEARIHPEGDAAFVLLPDRLPFWAWAETPTSEDKATTQTQIRAQLGLER